MVSGFGWSEENVDATQLRPRLKTFYHTAHHDVAAQVYPMAGVTPKDVDVFATYDSFSVHLLALLEGFGFCKEGEAGAFVQGGRIEIGGDLPCNTSGGMRRGRDDGDRAPDPLDGPVRRAVLGVHAGEGAAPAAVRGLREVPLAARPTCDRCLSDAFAWVALSGTATVLSWTTFRRGYFPEYPAPHTVVALELAEGPLFISYPVDLDPPRCARA
jgi:hypothetical protein